eukprot:scaffold391128_cov19-Prasinocladus_malaysianus.AAC.1
MATCLTHIKCDREACIPTCIASSQQRFKNTYTITISIKVAALLHCFKVASTAILLQCGAQACVVCHDWRMGVQPRGRALVVVDQRLQLT